MCINSNQNVWYNILQIKYLNDIIGYVDYSGSIYGYFISGNRKYIFLAISLLIKESAFKKLPRVTINVTSNTTNEFVVICEISSMGKQFNLSINRNINGIKHFWIGPGDVYLRESELYTLMETSWFSIHFNISDRNKMYIGIPSHYFKKGTDKNYTLSMTSIREID